MSISNVILALEKNSCYTGMTRPYFESPFPMQMCNPFSSEPTPLSTSSRHWIWLGSDGGGGSACRVRPHCPSSSSNRQEWVPCGPLASATLVPSTPPLLLTSGRGQHNVDDGLVVCGYFGIRRKRVSGQRGDGIFNLPVAVQERN